MESLLKILTAMAINKFNSSPAGSRMINGISSAKKANSLWEKFQPQQQGD